jgi:hypothetical protein
VPLASDAILCAEAPVNFERVEATGQNRVFAPPGQFIGKDASCDRSRDCQHSGVQPAWRTVADHGHC